MKCYLKRFDGRKRLVELPEGTREIAGVEVTGDEVLVYPFFCDPWDEDRMYDYLEGSFLRVWKDGKWIDKEDGQ